MYHLRQITHYHYVRKTARKRHRGKQRTANTQTAPPIRYTATNSALGSNDQNKPLSDSGAIQNTDKIQYFQEPQPLIADIVTNTARHHNNQSKTP